jgi:hypothetical protein
MLVVVRTYNSQFLPRTASFIPSLGKYGVPLMGYAGRSRVEHTGDSALEIYEREMAKRGRSIGLLRDTKPSKKHAKRKTTTGLNKASLDGLSWLNTAFRVHDSLKVQRLLALALEQRYAALRWDPRRPKGKRIQPALPWKKRTKKLLLAAELEINSFKELRYPPPIPLGPSVSEVLETAASDFGLSTTTLRRLVRCEAKSLSWVFAERLRKQLTTDEWSKLEKALLSPKARMIRDRYAESIDIEIDRLSEGRPDRRPGIIYTKAERRELDAFERQAKLLGAPANRSSLAIWRVFGPLLMWRPLTESLRNVPAADRLIFVRHGLRRELWLLRREMQIFRRAARYS